VTYILLAFTLAIATHPLYVKILERLKNKKIASFISVIIIILIIVIPTIIISTLLVGETINFFTTIDLTGIIDAGSRLNELAGNRINIEEQVGKAVVGAGQIAINSAMSILGSFSEAVIGLLIMFTIIYYLFMEGESWIARLESFMPFNETQKNHLLQKIKTVTRAVLYGEIMISIIQGILGGIAFSIAGIPNPVFWGFAMAVLAFLPFVGSGMIWVPAAIIKIAYGESGMGIFIIIYGVFIVGGIDYYLRPKIISGKSRVHPIIALLGAFGGLKLFGFPGLILGPLLASLFEALIFFYHEEFQSKKKENKTKKQ
jgi:predicted PurR-regulated permease PerM